MVHFDSHSQPVPADLYRIAIVVYSAAAADDNTEMNKMTALTTATMKTCCSPSNVDGVNAAKIIFAHGTIFGTHWQQHETRTEGARY